MARSIMVKASTQENFNKILDFILSCISSESNLLNAQNLCQDYLEILDKNCKDET